MTNDMDVEQIGHDSQLTQVIAGFIPLLDAAVLIAAKEKGFATEHGIDLRLIRETSWANIRDRIAVGHFDVAHMLAPMPIAATLNLTSLAVAMRAPLVLGLGGNAVTVSNAVAQAMHAAGWTGTLDPKASGTALAHYVSERSKTGSPPLRFGVVHPFSGHAYELRYWLADAGIDPDDDVEISVLPPPVMPDALKTGNLDGYCVGEPWNTIAITAGHGAMVTCKQKIWPDSPEKVLGVTETWAKERPQTLEKLLHALGQAATWCGKSENSAELAGILSAPEYLDCAAEDCLPALTGLLKITVDKVLEIPHFFQFVEGINAIPKTDQALWFYAQMVRWDQAKFVSMDADKAAEVFDHQAAVQILKSNQAAPEAADTEAARSNLRLFDKRELKRSELEDYILSFQR